MHSRPRETIRQIVQKHGKVVAYDAGRCESQLRDLCGSYKKEIFVLVSAVREGIPSDLLASDGVPMQASVARHSKRLHDNLGISEELSEWAVEAWAYALGLASQLDLRRESRCPSCDVHVNIPAK